MKYPSVVAKHAHPYGSPRAPAATTAAAGWRPMSPPLSLFIMFSSVLFCSIFLSFSLLYFLFVFFTFIIFFTFPLLS